MLCGLSYIGEYLFSFNSILIFVAAFAISFIGVFIMKILILKPIAEAEQNTVQRMDEFIGCKGEVITTIPTEGFGEVLISSQFGSNAIPAKTIGKKDISQGTEVIIEGVQDGVLLVQNIAYSLKTKIIRGIHMTIPLIIGGVLLAILILLILVFITKYRTVGPDEALIVTGNWLGGGKNVVTTDDGKKIKIIRGGGTFVVPIMQRAEPLSLLNYKLEVGTRDTYTKQGVPVTVNGVSIIKVGSTIEEVSTAAEQYLGKETEELKVEAKEVLEGHLRAILSSMTVEDAYSNREQFAQKVHEVASTDLKKMGLRIVSFTIKEIMDKNGYLDALGQPQIATVKRDATIANAEREKEARIEKLVLRKKRKRLNTNVMPKSLKLKNIKIKSTIL